jgi:hypothetical protein
MYLCVCTQLGWGQHAERLLQQCRLLLVSSLLLQVLHLWLQGSQLAAQLTSGNSHASVCCSSIELCKSCAERCQRVGCHPCRCSSCCSPGQQRFADIAPASEDLSRLTDFHDQIRLAACDQNQPMTRLLLSSMQVPPISLLPTAHDQGDLDIVRCWTYRDGLQMKQPNYSARIHRSRWLLFYLSAFSQSQSKRHNQGPRHKPSFRKICTKRLALMTICVANINFGACHTDLRPPSPVCLLCGQRELIGLENSAKSFDVANTAWTANWQHASAANPALAWLCFQQSCRQ